MTNRSGIEYDIISLKKNSTGRFIMNDISIEQKDAEKLQTLKKMTAGVYLCQALTFMLAGLPLLLGVAINFYKRKEVQGTWLESHFNWQIRTVWITLAGFAVSGLTLEMGVGFFILIATVVFLVYRITIGWYALNDEKPVNQVN
jgi:uncharacterized membrane protein